MTHVSCPCIISVGRRSCRPSLHLTATRRPTADPHGGGWLGRRLKPELEVAHNRQFDPSGQPSRTLPTCQPRATVGAAVSAAVGTAVSAAVSAAVGTAVSAVRSRQVQPSAHPSAQPCAHPSRSRHESMQPARPARTTVSATVGPAVRATVRATVMATLRVTATRRPNAVSYVHPNFICTPEFSYVHPRI